jgi:hypothetical protein
MKYCTGLWTVTMRTSLRSTIPSRSPFHGATKGARPGGGGSGSGAGSISSTAVSTGGASAREGAGASPERQEERSPQRIRKEKDSDFVMAAPSYSGSSGRSKRLATVTDRGAPLDARRSDAEREGRLDGCAPDTGSGPLPTENPGDAVLAAQKDYAASGAFAELLSIYHLLGDPALRLR